MLWYKAFLDTRGRFLIGLALLPCTAMFVVFTYPRVVELLPAAGGINASGAGHAACGNSSDCGSFAFGADNLSTSPVRSARPA